MTQVWAKTGSRPRMVKQVEYKNRYVVGSVDPLTGDSVGTVVSKLTTEAMSEFLAKLAASLDPDVHVVLVWDGAGFHRAKALEVPGSITLLFLPPYAPELNPMERVWLWMKDHDLSNRLFENEEAIAAACEQSWARLTPERLQSVAAVGWLSELGQLPARLPEERAKVK